MKNHNKLLLFIALLILGVFLSIQIKSTLENNQSQISKRLKAEQLKAQLNEGQKLISNLDESIVENEKKLQSYLKSTASNEDSLETQVLLKEVNEASLKCGLTSVKGPGIIINIDDAEHAADTNPEFYIIHNKDLYRILNELKIAGVQAISLNDERIISTSEQMCAGSMIKINKNKYSPPYEIKAIGDPATMEKQIKNSGVYFSLIEFNIRIKISKKDEITVTRYNNNIDNLTSYMEVKSK